MVDKIIKLKCARCFCPTGARGGRSLVGHGYAGEEGRGVRGQNRRQRSEPSAAAEEGKQGQGDRGQRRAVTG